MSSKSKPTPLSEARRRVETLRTQLADAERAEAAARAAEARVSAADCADAEAFRAARAAAAKVTADAEADVAFYREHLQAAETERQPLEVANAIATHGAAVKARADACVELVRWLDEVPALLEPVEEALAKVRATHVAAMSASVALGRLNERVPNDVDPEVAMLSGLAVATPAGAKGAALLGTLAPLVKHAEEAGKRAEARAQATADRLHREHLDWRRRAILGELGPDEQRAAEREQKQEHDAFYGVSPGRNVTAGRLPAGDPQVAAYRKNAGVRA